MAPRLGRLVNVGRSVARRRDDGDDRGSQPAVKGDVDGNAKLTIMMDVITVTPGATSVVGRGMILHRDPDDYKTQPTGNAGPRIACGVIQGR